MISSTMKILTRTTKKMYIDNRAVLTAFKFIKNKHYLSSAA